MYGIAERWFYAIITMGNIMKGFTAMKSSDENTVVNASAEPHSAYAEGSGINASDADSPLEHNGGEDADVRDISEASDMSDASDAADASEVSDTSDAAEAGEATSDTIVFRRPASSGSAAGYKASSVPAAATISEVEADVQAERKARHAAREKRENSFFARLFKKPRGDKKCAGSSEGASNKQALKKSERASDGEEGHILTERKYPRPFLLGVLFGTLKLLALAVVLMGFVCVGLVLGVAKAYVDTSPELDLSQLTISDRTSYIYDMNGDLITTFAGMEYRDWVDGDDIPDMLKNALISVEDVRFYKHNGVDFKRLFSAVVNTLRNSNTHGGSTLTQQLIKNKVLSNEQSYKRKIQEAYLAYELEQTISKDDILEAYMNDVFLGESNYGFAAAAKDYFGKTLDQLTIRECAMLAGMVQKPYYTNPRANTYTRFYEDGTNKMDVTNARTDVVLEAMYDAGAITREQYSAALAEQVTIIEVSEKKQLYDMPYFVEYGVYDVITHLLEQRGLDDTKSNRTMLENELRTGGYHIYLTVDPDIQNAVQDTITNWDAYPALQNPSAGVQITTNSDGTTMEVVQPQASAVIIDSETGYLRAIIGGRESPTRKKQLNRAYQSSMPVGSAIKPLSVYGPALDLGLSCGSTILNAELSIDGYGGQRGYPSIGSSRWIGLQTIRRGITSSLNVVAARTLFDYVTPEVGASYLAKLGVDESRINVDGPGLALGTSGITPIEMASAYATIANGGVYVEPLSFTVVLDANDSVILDSSKIRNSYRVYKETSAYMLVDMLEDVVSTGTGTNARIEGITTAGKTGTNNDYTSVYFAGFTGYYTGVLWIGHDLYSEKLASGSTGGNSAAPLWQSFMSQIHEGLSDKPIIDASPIDIGLTQVTLCSVSGKLATEACMNDHNNPPVTDWCAVEDVPKEYCDMHCMLELCSVSRQVTCAYCPIEDRVELCYVLLPTDSLLARLDSATLAEIVPNAIITDISAEAYVTFCIESGAVCSVHDPTSGGKVTLEQLISEGNQLITQVNSYLAVVQTLSDTDRTTLEGLVSELQTAISQSDVTMIAQCIEQLRYTFAVIYANNPPPTSRP